MIQFLPPPEIPPHLLDLLELQKLAVAEITGIRFPDLFKSIAEDALK